MALGLSIFIDIEIKDFFVDTIYTVSSIMFSIGIGVIVTFNLNGVKNKNKIFKFRSNLNSIRNLYIRYFFISTVFFIIERLLRDTDCIFTEINISELNIHIICNWSVAVCCFIFYTLSYYIVNFIEVQKLNNDIFDELNK